MTPLHQLPHGTWAGIDGVFTDIDDTLTSEGTITANALRALHDLRAAGLTVIAVTGRPVGWSEPFALSWPLNALVAENGAVALVRQPPDAGDAEADGAAGPRLLKLYQQDAGTRRRNHKHLQQAAARVLREVPGSVLARDSSGRETDIAIDHSEFAHLSPAQIAQVVAVMREAGLNATVSSIHVNGWIGEHDKWQGACWIARELIGIDLPAQIERWIYVGDSTNDQVMFQHFMHSVGVANIRRFESQLRFKPRYVTQGERGAGFSEVAKRLLNEQVHVAQRRAQGGRGLRAD